MAVVQNTLIGKSRGSVGGATFSSWKGLNILKGKAVSVSNPRTPAQQLQRAKMAVIVALWRAVSLFGSIGFKSSAVNQSEYNGFTSKNIKDAAAADGSGGAELNFPNVSLSQGTIGTTPIATATGTDASPNVVVTWSESTIPVGGGLTDIAYVAVYNETEDVWGFNDAATRDDEQASVVMPGNVTSGDTLHAYLFFKSADSDEVSDSVYRVVTVS